MSAHYAIRLRLLLAKPLDATDFPAWCERLQSAITLWSGGRSHFPAGAVLRGLRPSDGEAVCRCGCIVDVRWSFRSSLPRGTELDELIARLNVDLQDGSHVVALFALGADPTGGEIWFSFAQQRGQPQDHVFYKVMRSWGTQEDVHVSHIDVIDGAGVVADLPGTVQEQAEGSEDEDWDDDDSEAELMRDAFLWEGTYPSYRTGAGIDAGHWHYRCASFAFDAIRLDLLESDCPAHAGCSCSPAGGADLCSRSGARDAEGLASSLASARRRYAERCIKRGFFNLEPGLFRDELLCRLGDAGADQAVPRGGDARSVGNVSSSPGAPPADADAGAEAAATAATLDLVELRNLRPAAVANVWATGRARLRTSPSEGKEVSIRAVELLHCGQLVARRNFAPPEAGLGPHDRSPRNADSADVAASVQLTAETHRVQTCASSTTIGPALLQEDLYLHLTDTEYVRAMEAVLPGWGDEAARRRQYLEAVLRQSRMPALHETATRVVSFALPSCPVFTVVAAAPL